MPFDVDLVEYNCTEEFIMASIVGRFGDDMALSDMPRTTLESEKASHAKCITLTTSYGGRKDIVLNFAKLY